MNPSPEAALFALALTKPAEKRAAFLNAMCEGDSALRQLLQALLAAHEQPETLLATQAEDVRLREDAAARQARPTLKLELADAPDEAVGQTLGRYRLLERVGDERPRYRHAQRHLQPGCLALRVARRQHTFRCEGPDGLRHRRDAQDDPGEGTATPQHAPDAGSRSRRGHETDFWRG